MNQTFYELWTIFGDKNSAQIKLPDGKHEKHNCIYIADSLVDKASASGAGGRRFDSQCRRHWVRSDMAGW